MKKHSLFCIRTLLFILCIALMTSYSVGTAHHASPLDWIWGISLGIGFGITLLIIDHLLRGVNLRLFNATVLGLFVGYLLALAATTLFDSVLRLPSVHIHAETVSLLKIIILLAGSFLGVMATVRASEEFYCVIPFIRFTPKEAKSKKLILDKSSLTDGRVIDLAASGIIDHRLTIPRFLVKELYEQENSPDEMKRHRARSALAAMKRLESIPSLQLHYHDLDFPDEEETPKKMHRLARLLDADILTADINPASQETVEE
ncbi:MAG: putative PIN and TRAM-domain containing protein YacL, partial [Chlamydiae bacterium]|nr:putative PIN and TRAM-domain containing protein YacL [Chlamydiota bacterium]